MVIFMCLRRQIDLHNNNLGWSLNTNNLPTSLWNDKCDYIEVDKCSNLNPRNYNFVVMQLNIRSLLLNQLELKQLLNDLILKNSAVDVLLLSETFIMSKTEKLINMKGYSKHTSNRVNSKGGSTAILIKKEIKHKQRKELEIMTERDAESTFIEMVAKNGKKFVLGSLYQAPNTKDIFIDYVKETIHKIKCENGHKEIILEMDQNLNLWKANQHKGTSHFLDTMLEFDMIPTITRPMRITNSTATLIDNICDAWMMYRQAGRLTDTLQPSFCASEHLTNKVGNPVEVGLTVGKDSTLWGHSKVFRVCIDMHLCYYF